MTIGGFIAAPFTFGVSLAMSAAGMGISAAGTATATGAGIVFICVEKFIE